MSDPGLEPASDDESVVWQGQPRKRVVHLGFVVGVVIAVVVMATGAFLWQTGTPGPGISVSLLVVALFGFTIPTVTTYLWRKHTHYLLTDAALYHRTGVLWITVTELGLDKVQNTAYSQGVFGTLFDHGTVTVDTAGSEGPELRLRSLNDPDVVHGIIAARVGDSGGDDPIPGTIEQWRAALGEVRRLQTVLGAK